MRQFDAVFDELVSPHSEETIYGRVLRSYTKFKHSTNSELNLTLFRDVRHIMVGYFVVEKFIELKFAF